VKIPAIFTRIFSRAKWHAERLESRTGCLSFHLLFRFRRFLGVQIFPHALINISSRVSVNIWRREEKLFNFSQNGKKKNIYGFNLKFGNVFT
jgi:hypothetical protein